MERTKTPNRTAFSVTLSDVLELGNSVFQCLHDTLLDANIITPFLFRSLRCAGLHQGRIRRQHVLGPTPVSRIEFVSESSLYWPIIGLATRT